MANAYRVVLVIGLRVVASTVLRSRRAISEMVVDRNEMGYNCYDETRNGEP